MHSCVVKLKVNAASEHMPVMLNVGGSEMSVIYKCSCNQTLKCSRVNASVRHWSTRRSDGSKADCKQTRWNGSQMWAGRQPSTPTVTKHEEWTLCDFSSSCNDEGLHAHYCKESVHQTPWTFTAHMWSFPPVTLCLYLYICCCMFESFSFLLILVFKLFFTYLYRFVVLYVFFLVFMCSDVVQL